MTKAITDTSHLSTSQVLDLISEALDKNRKQFWGTDCVLARSLIENPEDVSLAFVRNYLRLLEELISRNASLTEFEAAVDQGKADTPQTALDYMDAQQELSKVWRGIHGRTSGFGLPDGITNTKGWSDEDIASKLELVKEDLDWPNTTGSSRKWWLVFEDENKSRVALVLRLAEELKIRKATITEFFLAYIASNTDNIMANLHFLDYTRLKKEEEKRKLEAAKRAMTQSPTEAKSVASSTSDATAGVAPPDSRPHSQPSGSDPNRSSTA